MLAKDQRKQTKEERIASEIVKKLITTPSAEEQNGPEESHLSSGAVASQNPSVCMELDCPDLGPFIRQKFNDSTFSDIKIIHQGTTFTLHLLVLSRLKYFQDLRTNNCKLNVHADTAAVEKCLRFYYGHNLVLSSAVEAFNVFKVALYLQDKDICRFCVEYFDQLISYQDAFEIISFIMNGYSGEFTQHLKSIAYRNLVALKDNALENDLVHVYAKLPFNYLKELIEQHLPMKEMYKYQLAKKIVQKRQLKENVVMEFGQNGGVVSLVEGKKVVNGKGHH